METIKIPFIEGDGIGQDIWKATSKVLEAAAKKYHSKKIEWIEVLAGEKSFNKTKEWLPKKTLETISKYKIAIKGPLSTPTGGGIRSLNVAIRQELDLYTCVRPVKWFKGVPSPIKRPEDVDMIVFRENSEDIYAGIEWLQGTKENQKVIDFLKNEMGVKFRFEQTSIGVKPISKEGTKRIVKAAIKYALENDLPSVTIVHKGNIMKFTEGKFKEWAYEVAKEFPTRTWEEKSDKLLIKDVIADAFLQQIVTRPKEYSLIVTMNLNGDYISDALAALVGGIGIAPGANINYEENIAVFEATHGTAPKYAGLDKVNPSSLILSGCMMLEHLGLKEASSKIKIALEKTIQEKKVTYDFARLMDVNPIKCSEFGEEIIKNLL